MFHNSSLFFVVFSFFQFFPNPSALRLRRSEFLHVSNNINNINSEATVLPSRNPTTALTELDAWLTLQVEGLSYNAIGLEAILLSFDRVFSSRDLNIARNRGLRIENNLANNDSTTPDVVDNDLFIKLSNLFEVFLRLWGGLAWSI